MKYFDWDNSKNVLLRARRGVGFEDIVYAILNNQVLDIVRNKSAKYSHQMVCVVNIEDYVYLVPFVEEEEKLFLKTIIPSRKATRDYLVRKNKNG